MLSNNIRRGATKAMNASFMKGAIAISTKLVNPKVVAVQSSRSTTHHIVCKTHFYTTKAITTPNLCPINQHSLSNTDSLSYMKPRFFSSNTVKSYDGNMKQEEPQKIEKKKQFRALTPEIAELIRDEFNVRRQIFS